MLNVYVSRKRLQQQRELDERRAQDDALQGSCKQMGDLLTEHSVRDGEGRGPVTIACTGADTDGIEKVRCNRSRSCREGPGPEACFRE